MPLVRRAILQRIATVSGPLQPTEKCVWKLGALLENWIASIRIGEGRNERRGKGNFFFLIFGGDLYSLSFIMEFVTRSRVSICLFRLIL